MIGCGNEITQYLDTKDSEVEIKENRNEQEKIDHEHFAPSIISSDLVKRKTSIDHDHVTSDKKNPPPPKKEIRTAVYKAKKTKEDPNKKSNVENVKKDKDEGNYRKLATIFFAHRNHLLVKEDIQLLQRLSRYLKKYPKHTIVMMAHMDASELQNLSKLKAESISKKVSIERILAIKKILSQNKVNTNNIEVKMLGIEKPRSKNPSDNRRVQIFIKERN